MSELKTTLLADMKTAMREKGYREKGVINLLRAGIQNQELDLKRELTAEEELKVVQRELKQTKQSLEEGQKADREDIVAAETEKITVIEHYLPKQLSVDEVKELMATLEISKDSAMGPVVGRIMKETAGSAEGKVVSQAVKEYLNS